MFRKILRFRAAVVIFLILAVCCSDAFAWGGGRDGGHGDRHYYRDGRWYRHGWLGFDIAVSALAIGALIDSLPPRYETVVVGNAPYYYYGNNYYRPYPYGGYVVVPPPPMVVAQPVMVQPEAAPVVMQAQAQNPGDFTVNIPSSRGGWISVTLRRKGNGFVGPQGEYYPENPTVEQLKVLYGR